MSNASHPANVCASISADGKHLTGVCNDDSSNCVSPPSTKRWNAYWFKLIVYVVLVAFTQFMMQWKTKHSSLISVGSLNVSCSVFSVVCSSRISWFLESENFLQYSVWSNWHYCLCISFSRLSLYKMPHWIVQFFSVVSVVRADRQSVLYTNMKCILVEHD